MIYKLINTIKTMSNLSEIVALAATQFIKQALKQAIKACELLKHKEEFNAFMVQKITWEMVYTAQFPQPNKNNQNCDYQPNNIPLDQNANYRLGQIQIPITIEPPKIQRSNSILTNVSKKIKKQQSIYTKQVDKGLFALSEPIIPQTQIQLQEEIVQVKRRLNFIRKLRKENDDQEKKRYQDIINRKHLQNPGKDFTYDFSGDLLIKTKQNLKKSYAAATKGISQDKTETPKSKTRNEGEQQNSDRDYLISRGQGGSREAKRNLFGNQGKRQISHLPFIKLGENIKIAQSSRNAHGPDTSRYTLKSYHSRGQGSFKHYSQMEKERTERIYSLKRSSKFSEVTEDELEQKPATQVQVRKQSHRMQKYLKKLFDDKTKGYVAQINKSSNFDRSNSPHDYSIHRYYKHNFDDDKKSICDSSLVSLRLNNSFIRQLKHE